MADEIELSGNVRYYHVHTNSHARVYIQLDLFVRSRYCFYQL